MAEEQEASEELGIGVSPIVVVDLGKRKAKKEAAAKEEEAARKKAKEATQKRAATMDLTDEVVDLTKDEEETPKPTKKDEVVDLTE